MEVRLGLFSPYSCVIIESFSSIEHNLDLRETERLSNFQKKIVIKVGVTSILNSRKIPRHFILANEWHNRRREVVSRVYTDDNPKFAYFTEDITEVQIFGGGTRGEFYHYANVVAFN